MVLAIQEELMGAEEKIHEHINKHRASLEATGETVEEKLLRSEMNKQAVHEALIVMARIASSNPEIKVSAVEDRIQQVQRACCI